MTIEQRSKYLSLLLRHKPETAKLTLDKEGWCDIYQLTTNTDFTPEELEEIVATDTKGRYTIRYWEMGGEDSGLPYTKCPDRIRANQGHSTKSVNMTFKKGVPPAVLYHGADTRFRASIRKEGLKPMQRHHVHLSHDRTTAEAVGARRKKYTIFFVDAKRMFADGHAFYISENGVWLVDHVPPQYLTWEDV